MKIRMLRSGRGSPDGIEVRQYEAGVKYDIPDALAVVFLNQGWAEEDKELEIETKGESTVAGRASGKKRRK